MPQLSIYVPAAKYGRLRRAAEREEISVSQWVTRALVQTLEHDWPEGFGRLYGSIKDASFAVPPSAAGTDTPREEL